MIASIISLILIHLKIIVYPSNPLWKLLTAIGFVEVVLFFVYTHFQDKKDLKTNFGRKKNVQ